MDAEQAGTDGLSLTESRFAAVVEAIYDAAAVPNAWPRVLERIADCFGDVGALLIYRREDGSVGTVVTPSLEVAQRAYESDEWWRHDIRFSRSDERGYLARTDAITERHIATADEVATLPFYTEFLRSHGLKWFAGTGISPDPNVPVALAVHRSLVKPAFSDGELILLGRIGRHVEKALRLGIRLVDAEAGSVALGDALDRVGVSVLLTDGASRIVFANAAGKRLLGDALLVSRGRLTARHEPDRQALEAALATVSDGGIRTHEDPRPVLLRGGSKTVFAAYVLPVRSPSGMAVERLQADVRAIVLVTASDPNGPADPTIVRDLLGLTLSEARVAALIGAGVAPQEAAKRLGITEGTARTALKRVFEKTGVSRQSELVAMLTKMMLRQGPR